tara:strand:+ start:12831 stop:14585 length:1755 start_codon:yes stop_codon:yes gene_type:complete
MARGNPIDAGEMFKAGGARNSEGSNPKAAARNKLTEAAASFVFQTVGGMAVDAIKSRKRNKEIFANQNASQTAVLQTQINKLPKGNPELEKSIRFIKEGYDADSKIASSLTASKEKKAESKKRMDLWMGQYHSLNAELEVYQSNAKIAQEIALSEDSEDKGDGNENMSFASNDMEVDNTFAQANGLLGRNLRWVNDINTTGLTVVRGGEWVDDPDKKNESIYQLRDGYKEFGSANYKDLKFSRKADNTMGVDLKGISKGIVTEGYKGGNTGWDTIEKIHKEDYMNKVNSYTAEQFKDFYFGGLENDYSTRRMTETAPAYQRLKSEYPPAAFEDDGSGNMVFKKGLGPGSDEWNTALTLLKKGNFGKGSSYRTTVGENTWGALKSQYEGMKSQYKLDNPKTNDPNGAGASIELFGNKVPKPTNSAMQTELGNVQDIANNRSIVTIRNQQYRYDSKAGGYRLEYAWVGDKQSAKLTNQELIPKAELIQTASTLYGNIALDHFGDKKVDGYSLDGWNRSQEGVMMENFKSKKGKEVQITGKGTLEQPFSKPPKDKSKYVVGKHYRNVDNNHADETLKWNGKRFISVK